MYCNVYRLILLMVCMAPELLNIEPTVLEITLQDVYVYRTPLYRVSIKSKSV